MKTIKKLEIADHSYLLNPVFKFETGCTEGLKLSNINIVSGRNGIGKSTISNEIVKGDLNFTIDYVIDSKSETINSAQVYEKYKFEIVENSGQFSASSRGNYSQIQEKHIRCEIGQKPTTKKFYTDIYDDLKKSYVGLELGLKANFREKLEHIISKSASKRSSDETTIFNYLDTDKKNTIKGEIKRLSAKTKLDSYLKKYFLNDTYLRLSNFKTKQGKEYFICPLTHELSSGEWDRLMLIIHLYKIANLMRIPKHKIVIIDKLFDTLDEANMLIAFSFMSELIEKEENITFIVLTHLQYSEFTIAAKNFNFINIDESYTKKINEDLLQAVIARNEQADLSKYVLHFYPKQCIPEEFMSFVDTIYREAKRYIDRKKYCPLAVAIFMRYISEKKFYDLLECQEFKESFLQTHSTRSKLEFIDEKGIYVENEFYLMCQIHNKLLHIKCDNYKFNLQKVNKYLQTDYVYNWVKSNSEGYFDSVS